MKRIVMLAALVTLSSLLAGPAGAQSSLGPDDHCSSGDAVSIANAFFPKLFGGDPAGDPFADTDDTTLRCQFRTFVEPVQGICFCETDIFIGGVAFFDVVGETPLPELWSTREFVELWEVDFTVIAPAGAEWSTFATPVKASRGLVVWVQYGVTFTNAVPGVYEVSSEISHPIGIDESDLVSFTVLPHETAHDLGRPVFPLEGSVTCPDPLAP